MAHQEDLNTGAGYDDFAKNPKKYMRDNLGLSGAELDKALARLRNVANHLNDENLVQATQKEKETETDIIT
jgi:hypothetical protein